MYHHQHAILLTMKLLIHWHHLGSKPFIRRTCCKNDHLTLSYAFSKSILSRTPSISFLWSSCVVSWRTKTLSKMWRPGIKAVCVDRLNRSHIW
jgi:hypothetical protein